MFTVSIVVSEHFMLLPVALFSLRISRLIHTIAINNKALATKDAHLKEWWSIHWIIIHIGTLSFNPTHRPLNKFTLPTLRE